MQLAGDTQAFSLLRLNDAKGQLPQFLFRPFALGDVAYHGNPGPYLVALQFNGHMALLSRKLHPILALHHHFDAVGKSFGFDRFLDECHGCFFRSLIQMQHGGLLAD